MARMTNQEELQRMISGLTDDDAAQALDYISWLAAEAETLNDPDLAAMYPGWTKVDCATTKSMVSQGRRDSTHAAITRPPLEAVASSRRRATR